MGRKFGPLLFALAAVVLWVSARLTWVEAGVADDKSGMATVELNGAFWALELSAVALVFLAGAVAGLALRAGARRVIGILVALIAAAVAWRPLSLLVYGADAARAQSLLQSAQSQSNAVDAVSISSWAVVVDTSVHQLGPLLALAGAAAALVGGILLALRPGQDRARPTRFQTKAARNEKLAEDLETSPDSGRVMWDALDEDIDPTDLDRRGPSAP